MHSVNPLNIKLNPICHLLALLGSQHILHISRIRVNILCIMLIYVSYYYSYYVLLST